MYLLIYIDLYSMYYTYIKSELCAWTGIPKYLSAKGSIYKVTFKRRIP